MKFFFGFISGIAFCIIGILIYAYSGMDDLTLDEVFTGPQIQLKQKPSLANYNFSLSDIRTGQKIDSNHLKNKVLLINFWEHWCVPCRYEMGSMDKLFQSVKDSTIEFVMISTEDQEKVKKDSVLKKYGFSFYHSNNSIPAIYDGSGVPRTFIVSKSGKVVFKEEGAANWFNVNVAQFLDSLKKE